MEPEKSKRHQDRFYRKLLPRKGLTAFSVMVAETDLYILAERDLQQQATAVVKDVRQALEDYIFAQPEFLHSLKPLQPLPNAPEIVRSLCRAAGQAGVGPMAAVAGAIAQEVGHELLRESAEVLVENGGDLFIGCNQQRTVALYAGESSPFSFRIGLKVAPEQTPLGICTSSGTVGHSLSFGKADAAVVISTDTALADAAATALGNRVRKPEDIQDALAWTKTVEGVLGAVVLIHDKMGAWGALELERL